MHTRPAQIPAQPAPRPFEPCQYPWPASPYGCQGHAVAVATATYRGVVLPSYRIDEPLCPKHLADRIHELVSHDAPASLLHWHVRSIAATTVVPVPTLAELQTAGA